MAFETLTVDLSHDERLLLIRAYLKRQMLPESVEVFESSLEEHDNIRQALLEATVNDAVVRALMEQIKIDELQEEEDATEK